jgi:hypothetical protein
VPFFHKISSKSTRIPKIRLASRRLPENFLYEIFLQLALLGRLRKFRVADIKVGAAERGRLHGAFLDFVLWEPHSETFGGISFV